MKFYKKIVSKINTKLFENFFFLSISQGLNFILPLLTFPYQVRVLGIEGFGLISFSFVFMSYFSIITDYGFNITGVREISLNRDNNKKINEIFNSIFIIKICLLVICFLIYLFIILSVDKFKVNKNIFILTYGVVIGQALYPIWFFQGIEKMKSITFFNILSKLIFTIGIFAFVKGKGDIILVPLFNSLGYITIAIISIVIVFNKYKISFKLQSIATLRYYIVNSWYIFISNVSVTLYTSTTTFLLGVLTNNSTVGYFTIANKIIGAIRSMYDPFSQVLFPYLSKLSKENANKVSEVKKIILKVGLSVMIPLFCILFIFGQQILTLVFKVYDSRVLDNLRIQSFIPILILFHIVFGFFTIILYNENKEYSKIIISAGLISIPLSYLLILYFKDIGASISILIIEFYITFRYLWFCKKKYSKFIY